jgi:hypothetical protein
MQASTRQRHHYLWKSIQEAVRDQRQRNQDFLLESLSFFIYRTDTNAVLARGIIGFEAAKEAANKLRKARGLKWDQVKFKAERKVQQPLRQFGVSADGRSYTNASGQTSRVDYGPHFNPSKGRRFRGTTDAYGNYADID